MGSRAVMKKEKHPRPPADRALGIRDLSRRLLAFLPRLKHLDHRIDGETRRTLARREVLAGRGVPRTARRAAFGEASATGQGPLGKVAGFLRELGKVGAPPSRYRSTRSGVEGVGPVSAIPAHRHVAVHLRGLVVVQGDALLDGELLVVLVLRLAADVGDAFLLVLVGVKVLPFMVTDSTL